MREGGLYLGTEITLEVNGLPLDWSKNSRGSDHGMLFQPKDRKRIRSDHIDYDYFKENNEDPAAMEIGFSRPLREVVPRLELLGFTLERAEIEYLRRAAIWHEEQQGMTDDPDEPVPDAISFSQFRAFATAHPLQSLDNTFISSVDSESDKLVQGRFRDEEVIRRLPVYSENDSSAYSELSYFAGLVGFLHPYAVLRVLAENQLNLDADVVWQYGPLVDNGWAKESEFTPEARRTQTFLIATEGSSDAHILKHAFALLRPEVEDFFRFIDVSERHPFPGTGNLLKFAEGLAKIDVHNQIIFLFDNDAEGFEVYKRLTKLTLPTNMRGMMLPELEQFRCFPAQGPEGVTSTDINRRAAAIECYLDLKIGDYPPATVIWTNYKPELGIYHGALQYKESYAKAFLKQTSETLGADSYDVGKLRTVLNVLISECSSMAAKLSASADQSLV
jgi:hypothetical protein